MKKYVAYYRVSTAKQGTSGLGLEAQRASVHSYTRSPDFIIAEYTEVESGKHDNREQLHAAISHAQRSSATLVIAKLDRLSRNAGFIFALRDSGVDFICADMPEANTLTIGIFATIAQYEREIISERTKAALAAKKAQGFKLGSPQNLTAASREKAAAARRKQAKEHIANIRALAFSKRCKAQGLSLRAIAKELNANGFKTTRNGFWSYGTVHVLLQRRYIEGLNNTLKSL